MKNEPLYEKIKKVVIAVKENPNKKFTVYFNIVGYNTYLLKDIFKVLLEEKIIERTKNKKYYLGKNSYKFLIQSDIHV